MFRALVVAATAVGQLGAAHALSTPEQKCQQARYKAAGTYANCQAAAQASSQINVVDSGAKFSSCRVKYTKTWLKLQAKAGFAGTSCSKQRFTDNGDGTVTDNLTGLQWEKKTNLDGTEHSTDQHDADNDYYGWNNFFLGGPPEDGAADGSVFTGFLSSLNSACFEGPVRLAVTDQRRTPDAGVGSVRNAAVH